MAESMEKVTSPDPRDPFAALDYILHEEETRGELLKHGETFSQEWERERKASRKTQLETIKGILAKLSDGDVTDELKVKLDKAWRELRDLESKFL